MLIGRETDVEQVATLLSEAREGRSGSLLLRGDPGIGKTALLEHAVEIGSHPPLDMTIVIARGIESESELPYAGLADLVDPLLDLRERLPPAQSLALGQALALEEGGTPPRFAVPAALLGLLGTAAEDRPVLALIDDAQWIDAPSIEAIVFVARRLRDEGVAMLLATRDNQRDERSAYERGPALPCRESRRPGRDHCRCPRCCRQGSTRTVGALVREPMPGPELLLQRHQPDNHLVPSCMGRMAQSGADLGRAAYEAAGPRRSRNMVRTAVGRARSGAVRCRAKCSRTAAVYTSSARRISIWKRRG